MKTRALLFRQIAFASVLFILATQGWSEGGDLLFKWSVVIKNADGSEIFTNSSEIGIDKERFKFIFYSGKKAYIYLFHYTENSRLVPLFPADSRFFEREFKHNRWYDIPEGQPIWYPKSDTDTGLGKYYLLVSESRLTRLESLALELFGKDNGNANHGRIIKAILDEVQLLLKMKSFIRNPKIENPVSIAGSIKTDEKDTVFEVKGVSHYARIISIKRKKTDNPSE